MGFLMSHYTWHKTVSSWLLREPIAVMRHNPNNYIAIKAWGSCNFMVKGAVLITMKQWLQQWFNVHPPPLDSDVTGSNAFSRRNKKKKSIFRWTRHLRNTESSVESPIFIGALKAPILKFITEYRWREWPYSQWYFFLRHILSISVDYETFSTQH